MSLLNVAGQGSLRMKRNEQMKTTYPTEIKVWSRCGYTPLTHRGGSYCDLLLETTIFTESPAEAKEKLTKFIAATKHGEYGHFNMQGYPNQNTRSKFISKTL